MTDLEGRVAAVALRCGIAIKPLSLSFVAKQMRSVRADEGAEPLSETELHTNLLRLQTEYPTQFGRAAPGARETAIERLERANAHPPTPKRPVTPGAIEMSDKQRAKLEKMTTDQRLDFANQKALSGELTANQRSAPASSGVSP